MLRGSVGRGGKNQREDVREVQTRLNRNAAEPKLRVDGKSGSKTERAIERFQLRIVKMRSPDGRVDPGGRTYREMRRRTGNDPAKRSPSPKSPAPAERAEHRSERRAFVDPRVREQANTKRIIDTIYPHFRGTKARVISGWLSDSDLFWKVNYHWEYLLWMVDHSLTFSLSKAHLQRLQTVRSQLLAHSPRPASGYRTSATVGKPEDSSSVKVFDARYRVVKQQKREFKTLTRDAGLAEKSNRSKSTFHLAAAPVAHPGTSKHNSGYALDIKGPAQEIRSVCRRLGATLIFDEKSHVHVEFKNGVSG